MAQDLVEVYVATGMPEANLIKSYLEANGIQVMAVQEGAGAAYGMTFGILGEVRLLVTKRQEAESRKLITEWQTSNASGIELEDDGAPGQQEP